MHELKYLSGYKHVPPSASAVLIINQDAIVKLMYAENSFPEAFDARS